MRTLSRRSLIVAGLQSAASLAWSGHVAGASPTASGVGSAARDAGSDATACHATPEQEEGPYYLQRRLLRRDIAEGRRGLPLALRLTVLHSRSCRPLRNAAVDVWHCDAAGHYSGYAYNRLSPAMSAWLQHHPGGYPEPGHPINTRTYLRGTQLTDGAGCAQFATIFPGCYAGRATHVHLKVRIAGRGPGDGQVVHTGQIFFPPEVTADVYAREPYATNRVSRTALSADDVYTGQRGNLCMAQVSTLATPDQGYAAALVLNIDDSVASRRSLPE